MNTAQKESQQMLKEILNRHQMFPPSIEEVDRAICRLKAPFAPRKAVLPTRIDQMSLDDVGTITNLDERPSQGSPW